MEQILMSLFTGVIALLSLIGSGEMQESSQVAAIAENNIGSVELNLLEMSPLGAAGGYAMPASGCSVTHSVCTEETESCNRGGCTTVCTAEEDFVHECSAPTATIEQSVDGGVFSGSDTTINEGQQVQIRWDSENATNCTVINFNGGGFNTGGATSGTDTDINEATVGNSRNFEIECTGDGGTTTDAVVVATQAASTQCSDGIDNDGDGDIDGADFGCDSSDPDDDNEVDPPPVVVLTADPTTFEEGESTTLTWTVDNATSCTASGAWSGSKDSDGGTQSQTRNNAATVTYTLTCTGPGGSDDDSAIVTVTAPGAASVACTDPGLEADPSIIRNGDTSTLTATPAFDTSVCTLTGPGGVNQSIPAGSCGDITVDITPTNTGTYTLNCGADGSFTERVQVLPRIQET